MLMFRVHPPLGGYLTPLPPCTTSSLGVAKEEALWEGGNMLGNYLLGGPRRGLLKELLDDGESLSRSLTDRKPAGTKAQDRLLPKALAGTLQAF